MDAVAIGILERDGLSGIIDAATGCSRGALGDASWVVPMIRQNSYIVQVITSNHMRGIAITKSSLFSSDTYIIVYCCVVYCVLLIVLTSTAIINIS